ncbi:tetratricopeptide repeat protein [bacterium]|nr:tetratricopeptide repeat protein [bacterium]
MKNPNKQQKLFLIATVLLLIIGIANYINYYAPPKSLYKLLSFSQLTTDEQEKLFKNVNNSNIKSQKSLTEETQKDNNYTVKSLEKEDLSENYINYAVDSNGKLVKWNKQKITVFVSPSDYQEQIYNALSRYNTVFDGFFRFYISNKRELSDVKIDVVDKFNSNDNPDSLYIAGLTSNNFTSEGRHLSGSVVQLLSKKPNSDKKVTKNEMYRVALHEIGHALGIIGHSPNERDIMYSSAMVNDFSARDIATLKMMYSNDEALIKRETKNFASTKLKEAEEYAKKTKNKAIPWVNLGRVYYDLDRKDDALNAYKKALTIEPNNPVIYQSMAECYYSSKKYETAIKYYKLAIDCSSNDEQKNPLINMIGLCYAKMENFEEAYIYFKQSYEFDRYNKMMLKNYLVACVETERKNEALAAIDNYKQKFPMIMEEEFIKDVLKWAK